MDMLKKWVNAFTKPPEELEGLSETLNALKRGDYLTEVKPEDSVVGQQLVELQKLRDEFSQYRAEEAAYHAAEEHRAKVAERKGFLRGVAATLIVTIIGNLFVYYWPSIVSILVNIFQKLPPR